MLSVGATEGRYTSTGKLSGYQVTVYHSGLDEYRHVNARDRLLLMDKVHNLEKVLARKWDAEVARQERAAAQLERLDKKDNAAERTRMAEEEQARLGHILQDTLSVDDTLDWDAMRNTDTFEWSMSPHFQKSEHASRPKRPAPLAYAEPPKRETYFKPPTFWQKVFFQSGILRHDQEKSFREAEERHSEAVKKTDAANAEAEEQFQAASLRWEKAEESFQAEKAEAEAERIQAEVHFKEQQDTENSVLAMFKADYFNKVPEAVEEYCETVLGNSSYSDFFTKSFDIEYLEGSRQLVVDFALPDKDDLPTLVKVTYVASRDDFAEKYLSDAALNRTYDSVIYQTMLRTLHELFEADAADAIDMVSLNGLVTSVNPASGVTETKCIASIQSTKDEFEAINLAAVDPKACFKALKGVAASKISSLTPVKPIMSVSREDRRFTDHYDVADALDDTTNLAAMDWEDFEHLIREVFAKEFSEGGGEVRVTKASRDGGVDAVAFDPDPIRGGKIVIQAKRYTNLVSVSAVRDLYGTVTSEGAIKGILVTTADYGPDAYRFAKDKPLTLLNGANLLHLLQSHGHAAKIDIAEAKRLAKA